MFLKMRKSQYDWRGKKVKIDGRKKEFNSECSDSSDSFKYALGVQQQQHGHYDLVTNYYVHIHRNRPKPIEQKRFTFRGESCLKDA